MYVGLYGYKFMDAAKNVTSLFKTRGWTAILTDVSVATALFVFALGVGLIAGLFGFLISLPFNGSDPQGAFILGFVFGYIETRMVMQILSSAVDTIVGT